MMPWDKGYEEAQAKAACADLDAGFDDDFDFFIIRGPEGWEDDGKRYRDIEKAVDRAEELAGYNLGHEFIVFMPLAVSTRQAVTTTIYL
jgi:hypothetical protein